MAFTAGLSILLGLILGIRHALDADHLAALSAIAGRARTVTHASLAGAWWGIGHASTLLLAGALVLGFRLTIPPALALLAEAATGAMLIALGIGVIRAARLRKLHMHTHVHGSIRHAHVHTHAHTARHRHVHRPFLVGLMHGIAGSGAVALLAATGMSSTMEGIAFLAVFGLGAMLGMMTMSAAVSVPLRAMERLPRAHQCAMISGGAGSVVIGAAVLVQTGSRIFI